MAEGQFPPPLLVLEDETGGRLIATSRQWPAKRAAIIRRIEARLQPRQEAPPALEPQLLAQTDMGDYVEQDIAYSVSRLETRAATLYLPKPLAHRQPAVLCCPYNGPQTMAAIAKELVKRRFVAMIPHEPRLSAQEGLWEHQRALDCLCNLDAVDSDRLACLGQGRGGLHAIVLAAFEHRIKACAAACAYAPIKLTGPEPWRDFLDPGEPPAFEWIELLGLIAPRAFHYTYAQQDEHFPYAEAIAEEMIELARLYDLLGCRERFVTFESPVGHGYPAAARREAYALFREILQQKR